MNSISRRDFIKTSAIGGIGLAGALHYEGAAALDFPAASSELYTLSTQLVREWAQALIRLQITDKSNTADYGGIICPALKMVHGRIGDTIYPFFHMAKKTGDSKYLDSSMLLYQWMEKRVSQPDGSWLNEPKKGSWKGTTVFSAIALGETIKNHGSIMEPGFRSALEARLAKAGNYVYDTFTIEYGNINYPISASYCLSLLGELLDIPKFKARGRDFAHQSLQYITKNDGFIYGEGTPLNEPSKKGCLSVDLGYNVEESLPSLVMYGLLTNDTEVLEAVTRSLQTHMEFMLPDGGWDNSWGTRNYKWTYWGSRTTDGCQPAYALLADRDPRFYKVALKSTQLLRDCSKDGLIYGGPHYISRGVLPSVHHTFCHIKALATLLDHRGDLPELNVKNIQLPREENYGSRFFSDIQTVLVSKGKFRATVTIYDRDYKDYKNGHASGGALSLLWHEKTGPIFAASMNEYQLYEADNMQKDADPLSMPLTPRIELKIGEQLYMNICDFNSQMEVVNEGDTLIIHTISSLVDKDQKSPASGAINCRISYYFSEKKVILKYSYSPSAYDGKVKIIFPVVSMSTEKVSMSEKSLKIKKESSAVTLSSDRRMHLLPTTTRNRVFNFVPGLEAIPLCIDENSAVLEIKVG